MLLLFSLSNFSLHQDNSWDVLIFTQHYPLAQCIEWKEKSPKNNCTLPTEPNLWTIHGLWPTKKGSKQGPHFCNKTLKFNKEVLKPILNELETYWLNIEANTNLYTFWKQEWMKHGTCAVTLPEISDQLKYFSKAIELKTKYPIGNLMAAKNIIPNINPYNVNETYDALRSILGVRPVMQCISEKSTKHSLLSEIQICFNKSLELIDCGILNPNKTGILSDCSLKKPLYYYHKISDIRISSAQSYYNSYYNVLINLHKIITTLIKITL